MVCTCACDDDDDDDVAWCVYVGTVRMYVCACHMLFLPNCDGLMCDGMCLACVRVGMCACACVRDCLSMYKCTATQHPKPLPPCLCPQVPADLTAARVAIEAFLVQFYAADYKSGSLLRDQDVVGGQGGREGGGAGQAPGMMVGGEVVGRQVVMAGPRFSKVLEGQGWQARTQAWWKWVRPGPRHGGSGASTRWRWWGSRPGPRDGLQR